MQKTEIAWRNDGEWKARYSKLYSSQNSSRPIEDHTSHVNISFMSKKPLLFRSLQRTPTQKENTVYDGSMVTVKNTSDIKTLLSHQSDSNHTNTNATNSVTNQVDSLNGYDTLLLDMVRAKMRDINAEAQDKTLELLRDDVLDAQSSDACVHGLSMRMTDRSMSRRSISRVSRVSTRRDMDIASILAFTATVIPPPAPLEIEAFKKMNWKAEPDAPKWSIRRSICPVCSQKWRDKSSISIIKNSGLKRNSSADLPTVTAPGKLRTSITTEYTPRPVLAVVDENKPVGRMKNSAASWQLTRARRFRAPKVQIPPPEATAPPSATAPMARKDLDIRINRFLKDEGMEKYMRNPSFNYKV